MVAAKTIKNYYLLLLGITLLIYGIFSILSDCKIEDYTSVIKENIADITNIELINKSPRTYLAYINGEEKYKFYIIFTAATGYQSVIEVMTIISNDGKIEAVHVINHGETPAFFNKLAANKFTHKFSRLSILEPVYTNKASGFAGSSEGIYTDNSVDAVSGSTISSVAISKAVNEGFITVANKNFDAHMINPYDRFSFGLNEIGLLLIYIIVLLSVYKKVINKFRKWILIYSVIIVGFYLNKFLTFGFLYSFMSGNWPDLNNITWYLLIFGTLGLILISGRNLYCSWICPFGAAQEVILKFGGLKPIILHSTLIRIFRLIPPTLAYLALMIVFYTKETQSLAYAPFSAIFNLTTLPIMWKTLPFLIFISFIQYRFYCTYFCPIGFILNLITGLRKQGAKLWKK